MKVNIDRLKEGDNSLTIDADELFEIDKIDDDIDLDSASDLSLNINRTSNDYLYVKGECSARLKLVCDKCAEDFYQEFDIELDSIFHLGYLEDNSLNDIIIVDEKSHELDLSDNFRESILVSVPFIKSCSENCKGICSDCGTNLNKNTCKCSHEDDSDKTSEKAIDPRWAKLAEISKKMKEEEKEEEKKNNK